jgi:surface protein
LSKLDVENWEVSNVTDMRDLFDTCTSLKELNLGSWDISKVTELRYFVRWCSLLTKLNIDNWKINNITDISTSFIDGVNSLTFISMKNTNYQSVNKLISVLPSRADKEAGTIDITGVDDISRVNISAAQNKNLIIIS